ncbi:hypothetical protein PCANC_27143, partial [Puccinia coronata f. sp. avenae]
ATPAQALNVDHQSAPKAPLVSIKSKLRAGKRPSTPGATSTSTNTTTGVNGNSTSASQNPDLGTSMPAVQISKPKRPRKMSKTATGDATSHKTSAKTISLAPPDDPATGHASTPTNAEALATASAPRLINVVNIGIPAKPPAGAPGFPSLYPASLSKTRTETPAVINPHHFGGRASPLLPRQSPNSMVLKYDAVVAALKDMFDKGQQLEDWLDQERANYTGVHTKFMLADDSFAVDALINTTKTKSGTANSDQLHANCDTRHKYLDLATSSIPMTTRQPHASTSTTKLTQAATNLGNDGSYQLSQSNL